MPLPINTMKKYICILAGAALLAACEQKTETTEPAASPAATSPPTTTETTSPASTTTETTSPASTTESSTDTSNLPAGQPNLLLRPRQLPKFVGVPLCKSSPEILREKTSLYGARTRTSEASCARNPLAKTPLVLRLAVGDSRSTVARSTITGVHGTFVLLFKSASPDARVRI